MDKIIELAKKAGAVSYTNRHYPDRPYRTFGPEELMKFYTIARADLEADLAATRDLAEGYAQERNELKAENAKLRAALKSHIRMYRVDDQAWDHEAETERLFNLALGETK